MKLTPKAEVECRHILDDNPPAAVRDAAQVLLCDAQQRRHIDPVALGVLFDYITKSYAQDRYGR